MSTRKFYPHVAKEIKDYFNSSDIKMKDAANMLKVTVQTVSLQLKQPFEKEVSKKWAVTFGFNQKFLLTGQGSLFSEQPEAYDKERKHLKIGDKVIFPDTEGHLHCRPITDIICKYVNNWDYGLTEVKYSRTHIDGNEPDEILLYFDMGDYATPVIINSEKTFKYNP